MSNGAVSQFPRIRLGVSDCLLGQPVRYDGGHKRHAFVAGALAAHAQLIGLCPEAAIGMGVPRPPIQLTGPQQNPRARGVDDPQRDVTGPLQAFARAQIRAHPDICGYIFKKNSPSCGLRDVQLFGASGDDPRPVATGVYAAEWLHADPQLPVAEESDLDDSALRDNFLTRVYVRHRWQALLAAGVSAAALIDFHSAHKYLLMAHNAAAAGEMGVLLADLSGDALPQVARRYGRQLTHTLAHLPTRGQHHNVLLHIAGHLKHRLPPGEKADLSRLMRGYLEGTEPRWAVIDALRAAENRYPDPYLRAQVYLSPYPMALQDEA